MEKILTSKKYLENCGNICPVCRSQNISAGNHEPSSNEVWFEVTCKNCGATWQDVYELVCYDNLKKGTH